MLVDVLHIAHFLKRFVLVSLPNHGCSMISVAGVRFSLLLYLCIVGKDFGMLSSRSVSGSFRLGPYFLKTCLADFSLYFLAKVFASDS
jgi:hypothetical protein